MIFLPNKPFPEEGTRDAGAFSGLLAYGISFMHGIAGLLGWSWIFVSWGKYHTHRSQSTLMVCIQILEGIATVIVGVIALIGSYFLLSFDLYDLILLTIFFLHSLRQLSERCQVFDAGRTCIRDLEEK